MKILNVNSTLDPVTGGGAAERTLQLSRAQIQLGLQCNIMTTDVGLAKNKIPDLINGHIIVYKTLLKRFYVPCVKLSEIRKEVENVDIVHLMGHWSILNAMVFIACKLAKKPYVVCPAGALPIFGRSKFLKFIYNCVIGYKIIKNAYAHIAITDDERDHFKAYAVERNQVKIISNGVNVSDYVAEDNHSFRANFGLGSQPFVLFLGRLNIIKGPDLLLEAFAKGQHLWPDWHLVFAGPDGGLQEMLKTTAKNSSISDRIHFIGYVGGEDKSKAYHAANLMVIPSRQEAMSIVVLESGISGTPVLLTYQCGFNDVANTGGGMVTDASVESLYSALTVLLKDTSNLKLMGLELKKFVQNKYTWDIVVEKYVDLYSKLLNKNTI
jgi:glycosyltransferase involved in cell wall biosynthesis